MRVSWVPGNGNGSFFLEYGTKGFVRGSGTMVTGTYGTVQPRVYLNGLSPETEYEIYFGELCNSGADSTYLKGSWMVKTLPACVPVGAIRLDYISPDSAVFFLFASIPGGTPGIDSLDYEYGPQGFEQGTGTGGTFAQNGGIGGLTPLTYYDIYVRTNCLAKGYGTTEWIGPYTFYTACPGPMSGVYTINTSQPLGNRNYKDFKLLVSDLQNCGVSGPVTINVASGVYSESVSMQNIPGASAVNTIVIQADTYTSNTFPVEVKYNARGTGDNYVWKMNNVSYVTLKGLIFTSESTSGYGRVLDIDENCSHLKIIGNTFNGIQDDDFNGISTYGAVSKVPKG